MSSQKIKDASVRWMKRVEGAASLDPAVDVFTRLTTPLNSKPLMLRIAQGRWLGHALHPALTDIPLGLWSSAMILDATGGKPLRPAATRLMGLGIITAVPTAVTGVAELTGTDRGSQRVGVVHAISNAIAIVLYSASWMSRRSGSHRRGVVLALCAGASAAAGGYLGGHLIAVRRIATRHEGFDV